MVRLEGLLSEEEGESEMICFVLMVRHHALPHVRAGRDHQPQIEQGLNHNHDIVAPFRHISQVMNLRALAPQR